MAATRECNSAVTVGRLSKAIEFLDAAESLEDDKPNAAGDLFGLRGGSGKRWRGPLPDVEKEP